MIRVFVRTALTAVLFAAVGAPLAAQAPAAPQRSAADGVFTEAQAQRGEMVFRQVCAACHTSGEFNGEAFLKRWPTAGSLFDIVSSTMPQDNPGGLSAQQYADVLSYFLKSNGFRSGPTELPQTAEALKTVTIPERPPR